jgi:ribonuclease-3
VNPNPPLRPKHRLPPNNVPDLAQLQRRLGCQFHDERLLQLALTHPSIAHENSEATPHNQRLEFLGDAVLQLVLTEKLYATYPGFDEGQLSKGRAKLVNGETLAELARTVDLGQYLILSRGEESNGGRDRASTLADAFEALLGAIFLDAGLPTAHDFILREFEPLMADLDTLPGIDNPKGELQEFLQARSSPAPEYVIIATSGPDHDRDFECAVMRDGVELARGQGKSKKAAESEAALAALKSLRETESLEPKAS